MTAVALGIDLGTSSTKAALVDEDGVVRAVDRSPHQVDRPQPGWSETDPRRWWDSATAAVTGALATARADGSRVEVQAIGLCGQMHGTVLVDGQDAPTRPAVLWPDRRAATLLRDLQDDLRPHLDVLANPTWPGMAGPILAWLVQEEPDAVERAVAALQPKDWLRLRLTARRGTDPSDASATLLRDPVADRWIEGVLELFQIPERLLPPVVASDEAAGELTDAAAEALGLPPGLPVAAGGGDTPAGLLGAGLGLGEPQLTVGTGGQLALLLERPIADATRRTHLYRAATDEPRWYALAAVQNAGLAIDWALDRLGVAHDERERLVASSPIGARGAVFLPFLTGERTPHVDPGLAGGWRGLRSEVTRADLVRAVHEGVAFALLDALDALREAGHVIDELLLAGGGSRDRWLRQLLADVLGVPLTPHDVRDASARGAALLGWAAAGRHLAARSPARGATVEPAGTEDYRGPRAAFRQAVARDTAD